MPETSSAKTRFALLPGHDELNFERDSEKIKLPARASPAPPSI
jgi:hypothetical protein